MGDKSFTGNCEHKNWTPAGYSENIYGMEHVRVQSIYEVYCMDCKNFVDLFTKEIINNKGLIAGKIYASTRIQRG